MAALARHSTGFAPAYGIDPLTQSVTETFCEIFERKVAVFFRRDRIVGERPILVCLYPTRGRRLLP